MNVGMSVYMSRNIATCILLLEALFHTVRIFKIDATIRKPFRHWSRILRQTQTRKALTRIRKIRKRSLTVFQKLMCVRAQRSSEKNFPVLGRSLLICGRSLPVCGGDAPQMHFGKPFRIVASILKMRTVHLVRERDGLQLS